MSPLEPLVRETRESALRDLAGELHRVGRLVDQNLDSPSPWRGELRRSRSGEGNVAELTSAYGILYDELADRGADQCLDVQELLLINQRLTLNSRDECAGFRTRAVRVRSGAQRFAMPEHRLVPDLVDETLHAARSSENDPVLVATQLHLDPLRLHPFVDGNGRTARLAASCVLWSAGFRSTLIIAVEQYTSHDRDEYFRRFDALEESGGLDTLTWIGASLGAMSHRLFGVRTFLERRRQILDEWAFLGRDEQLRML